MLINIKLYGGLVCDNPDLDIVQRTKFKLDVPDGYTISQIHQLLNLKDSSRLVNIVNGSAQPNSFRPLAESQISIFPPMADRQHDFFQKI